MSVDIVRTLREDDWRRFVADHPAGNVFHTPEIFEVFARAKGHRPELWAAMSNERVLALLLPVRVSVLDGVLRHVSTRSVAYGSVLCAPGKQGQEALRQLLSTYACESDGPALFTELRNLSDLGELQLILREQGFDYQSHLNYLIDINRPASAVFENIGRRTRKNIRHALNKGQVHVEEATEPEQLSMCYELLRRTFRAAHVPLGERSLFDAAFEVLYPKRMIRFTLARVGGEPAAASVDLLFKDVMYGWYGGADRTYASYTPNEVLTWEILRWGAENGYRIYDFGGAGRPDEAYGVRDFKAKFGGKLVSYGRNRRIHAPLLFWVSEKAYRVSRGALF